MSDYLNADPEDYAEAVAWFNECKARRARDKARIAELEADRITLTGKLAKALKRAEQAEAEWKKWQHACGEAWVALGVARKELKRYKRGCRCEL
jgi:3-deoxy-D-manno-octulosonic-acid transferase